ncbi:MAG: elongation factor-1 alpha [Methylococcaceae bacterium]|nr:elongation factor-1 alpha [Methylococcaceae bacterium]
MKTSNNPSWINLPSIGLSLKALFSGYLITIGLGALIASAQIMMTHGMADGELGLSIDDIVYSYHGDPKHSKIETKLNGSMKDKAPLIERTKIIKWVRNGASKEQWDSGIKTIFDNRCIACHSTIPGLPDFTQLEEVQAASKSSGASMSSLTRVSHIHIFAIAFIFFFNGLIFSLSVGLNRCFKALMISLPFLCLIFDVFSWWLTKIHPSFAWITMISGISYSLISAITWVTSMYQMWIMPLKGKKYTQNAWRD